MATDLSASSRHAGELAALLAHASDACLSFMHVVSGSALDGLRRLLGAQANIEEGLLKAARHELHELASPIAQHHGLQIEELIVSGAVVEEIVAAAQRAVADLVVVGAHSAESVAERLLGSTTARLLRTARCPVIVSKRERPEPYRRVLVPVDFSPWTAAAIKLASEVAPGAHLVLMHAWELPFEGLLRRADIDAAQVEQYKRDLENEVRGRVERVAEDHG
ncbi:MAG: universal stress protein, partial [Luteimonas sp.]|nr:universal stress protein [Luteimonas sp.]